MAGAPARQARGGAREVPRRRQGGAMSVSAGVARWACLGIKGAIVAILFEIKDLIILLLIV